jgi:hypothetical protein
MAIRFDFEGQLLVAARDNDRNGIACGDKERGVDDILRLAHLGLADLEEISPALMPEP